MKVLFVRRMGTLRNAFPGDLLTHSLRLDFQESRLAESAEVGLNSGPRSLAILGQRVRASPLRLASLRKVQNFIKNFSPDVIFTAFQDQEIFDLAGGVPVVHWLIEARMSSGDGDRFSRGFEDRCAHVFSAASRDGSHEFLPLAVSPRFFRPQPGAPKRFPISFTGSWYADREAKYRQMLYPLGDKAHTFGRDWPRRGEGVHHHGMVDPTRLPGVYSSSQVCLNIHHPAVAEHGGLNLRTFEILACHGLMICDRVKGIEDFLEPGKDFIQWDGGPIRDLVESLSETDVGGAVSERGYLRYLRAHTTAHRAKRIAEVMRSM